MLFCNVLQCKKSLLSLIADYHAYNVLQCAAVFVIMCCSMCCNVLQCALQCEQTLFSLTQDYRNCSVLQCTLQRVAACVATCKDTAFTTDGLYAKLESTRTTVIQSHVASKNDFEYIHTFIPTYMHAYKPA